MDVDIGIPTGSYYASQNVYMRNFSSGKVLFNPSAGSHNIILGQNYYLTNGTRISTITLDPWSGEIVFT